MRRIANKSKTMKQVEDREGIDLEELLRRKYVDENKSIQTIAHELQISYITVVKWLGLANITSRKLRV